MTDENLETVVKTPPSSTPSFSQEEVNAIVQKRLARQEATLEGLHASEITRLTKAATDAKTAFDARVLELQGLIDAEKVITAEMKTRHDAVIAREVERLAEQKKQLPEEVVALLDTLPHEGQLKWLEDNAATKYSVTKAPTKPAVPPVPPTPEGNELPDQSEVLASKNDTGLYGSL